MPRAALSINRFNAGKLSKLISARTDQAIRAYYDAGAQVLTNWISMVEGPIIKRSGFRFLKEVRKTAVNVALVPFEETLENAFMLEITNAGGSDEYIRFIKNRAAILETSKAITGSPTAASPVSVGVSAHSYSTGDEVYITGSGMAELNGRYFTITSAGAGAFTLDGEDGIGRSTGTGGTAARTYEIAGFTAVDVASLQYAQHKNILYCSHGDQFPQKLVRTTDISWALSVIAAVPDWLPFEYDDTSGVTIQASAATGSITLTASTAIFVASDVGRRFRLTDTTSGIGPIADTGGEGFAVITAVTSPPSTTATATVEAELDPQVVSSPTSRWARDAWNAVNGYPSSVTFFDDRLWFSGVAGLSGEVWSSRIGSYEDFSRLTTDVGGLHFDLQGGQSNNVQWMEGLDETLIMGTSREEHTVTSLDPGAAVSAGNIRARRRSRHGSRKGVRPEVIDDRVVFAHRAGRKLRDFRYKVELNELDAIDLTRLSREITIGKIKRLSYQQEPNRLVWSQMEDGSLAVLTHEYNELVMAWSDIDIGGTASVSSSAALPSETETTDEFLIVTSRTIDGNTVLYIEQLEPFWEEGTDIEDAFCLDCAIRYDVTETKNFTGAHHLEGETVAVFADGFRVEDVTIVDGSFTLTTAASEVLVGYEYVCQYLSMPLEGGSADGTSQGKPGSVARLMLRLDQAGEGLYYGTTLDPDDLRPIAFREVGDPMDVPVPLFDGDKPNLPMPMNQTTRMTISLEHRGVLPCTVVGAFPRLEVR